MISLLVVNYRSAALAANAIRSARAATSQPLQVIVVDNSVDAAEAESLRGAADVLIVSQSNRGYAGGINDGRRACEGDVIVAANPDVVFAPGALDALADALDAKTAVAGPALFWDDAHSWRLPPGDLNSGPEKLDEVLASRSPAWRAQRDLRRFRARAEFWSLQTTTHVRMLSGAVLAMRASAFDAVGGFDERFRLYFEEADFLRRIAQHRQRIVYVPQARCRHLYNQSARHDAQRAAALYAESELRYLEKWNGPFAARALKRFERPVRIAEPRDGTLAVDRHGVIVEASPLPSFATAAGCFASPGRVALPPEIAESIAGSTFYLRSVVRATGEVLATVRISA
ncbi:MAG TPA: glycosyltransferase family 2 protein [Thermoanaerobaculia bacterium]|jgi:N-acetylglucosaminyl-diphospho-decaprenol L-rhamnosyltransferase